jgi:hypothetical protein
MEEEEEEEVEKGFCKIVPFLSALTLKTEKRK